MAERREAAPYCLSAAEVAPTSTDLLSEAEDALRWGRLCLLYGQTMQGERLHREQEDDKVLTLLCW